MNVVIISGEHSELPAIFKNLCKNEYCFVNYTISMLSKIDFTRNYDVIFLEVQDYEDLKIYIPVIKQLREQNIWSPVCFITNIELNYKSIINELNGYNCISIINRLKYSDKESLENQIKNVLFISSDKGLAQLQAINKSLKNLVSQVKHITGNAV